MKKIIGIGNAIVDIICKVDDDFLLKNSLAKSSMVLIDENMAQKLSIIKQEKITSGGSLANSLALISELGNETSFIGKVANDEFGDKFISELEKSGAHFVNKNFSSHQSAKSFILVCPQGERTMCTFLGCASDINEDDIEEKIFLDASILYLEGYLWDKPNTIKALKKAIFFAKKHHLKIAFNLCDSFCVNRHKTDFLNLVINEIDILFANESEIKELVNVTSIFEDNFLALQSFFSQNKKLIAAITRSEKGCVIFSNQEIIELEANKINRLIDSTGAGDIFAGAFLFELNKGSSLIKCGEASNFLAAKIIQKLGARFDKEEIKEFLKIIP